MIDKNDRFCWDGDFLAPGCGQYVIFDVDREVEPGEVCERLEQAQTAVSMLAKLQPLADEFDTTPRLLLLTLLSLAKTAVLKPSLIGAELARIEREEGSK